MAIIGTPEQVAAYSSNPWKSDTDQKPIYNGVIIAAGNGYKNGALIVSEWLRPANHTHDHPRAHWYYQWYYTVPLTKAGTVAKAQIEKRVPNHLHEVFRAALKAYKARDKSDPEFVFIF